MRCEAPGRSGLYLADFSWLPIPCTTTRTGTLIRSPRPPHSCSTPAHAAGTQRLAGAAHAARGGRHQPLGEPGAIAPLSHSTPLGQRAGYETAWRVLVVLRLTGWTSLVGQRLEVPPAPPPWFAGDGNADRCPGRSAREGRRAARGLLEGKVGIGTQGDTLLLTLPREAEVPLLCAFAADEQQQATGIAEGVVLDSDLRLPDDCVRRTCWMLHKEKTL